MPPRALFLNRVWISILVLGSGGSALSAKVNFSRQILPILSDNCFYCHGPDPNHRKEDLRLDTEAGALEVIERGHSDNSELIARITAEDPDDRMPPLDSHKKLTPQQIKLITQWVDEGAAWGEHWSFTALTRPEVPALPAAVRGENPIDAFVGVRLHQEGLHFAPEAERTTLIRRLSLDLTGLPPTPEAVNHFVSDTSPQAYENLVERLLASPAYGERMAWDWLEVARYADSNGYQGDADRTMWPWRDWVVQAFNQNLPYNEFTRWQIAGDLMPAATTEQKLATAFLRNHPINGEGGRIPEENRVDYVMDMTETTATAWLGLTYTCARCHDHKFDPITRKDYYSLFAFFNQTPVTGAEGDPQTKPVLDLSTAAQRARREDLERGIRVLTTQLDAQEKTLLHPAPEAANAGAVAEPPLTKEARDALAKCASDRSGGEIKLLEEQLGKAVPELGTTLSSLRAALQTRDDFKATLPKVMVMEELSTPRQTYVLERGIYTRPVEEVHAATMAKLPPMPDGSPLNRLGLANWLVAPDNPLTARVTVNRLWQMLFGLGLVKTSEDFGTKGELPLHPELLDWLACELRDSGWDVKHLLRLIVTSRTYRQSSKVTPAILERDPDNRLFARGARFRLPSWMIRDQALAVSGLLSPTRGGPAVKSYQPDGVWEEATFGLRKYVQDHGEALYRRSLYTFWRRIIGPTQFFDTPSRLVCNVKPTRTNTPLHALATLNDTAIVEAARVLAEHALHASAEDDRRMDWAFRNVLARAPTATERTKLLAGLAHMRTMYARQPDQAVELLKVGESDRDLTLDAVTHAAWTATCLALLNLDETLTKE